MSISLGILGITGKLGRMTAFHAKKNSSFRSISGCGSPDSIWKGKDIGELFEDKSPLEICIEEDPEIIIQKSDILIDVSSFEATENHIQLAIQYKKPLVIGVTGHPYDIEKSLEKSAERIPIFFTPNFSPAIAICNEIGFLFSKFLQEHYKMELIETHHIHKKDRPSGTSLQLAKAFGQSPDSIESHRSETILAQHALTFRNSEEVLEITHKAFSRDVFALGALEAAFFLHKKPCGLYTMKDLVNPYETIHNKPCAVV
ncbi:MAG: hypothetical protein HKM07_08235 [Chlamydiae bacterium]|nr:hypothetical protein [Chlamydiota bacterium]